MALHFPSEQESALSQAGVPRERRKSGTERAEVTPHTPANPVRAPQFEVTWGFIFLGKTVLTCA